MSNRASFQRLLHIIDNQDPKPDRDLIARAYAFANTAHAGQKRIRGEDYIEHPIAVAITLAKMKLDSNTIAAGMLHDVMDDTPTERAAIEKEFGADIAQLVEGVTKLGKVKYRGLERYIENLRKMFVAMAKDIRVILIKFADRLHNLKTISVHPIEKQQRIARESIEIYAAIAHRLEMGELRDKLEDLSFQVLYPKEYEWLSAMVTERYAQKEKYLDRIGNKISRELHKAHVEYVSIHGRTKHLYSLWKKMQDRDRDISRIYDLVALRVVVNSVPDCYTTLGIVHAFWKPLKGRIKDYIAQPKPNGYQSLHTTVFCDEGEVVEFQIRTRQMHEEAEYGITAHWYYDEHGAVTFDKELSWVKELNMWQKKIKDTDELMETLKIDLFRSRIFVFTPRGDVIDLPEAATPVDLAYHIHTSLGDQCVSAKVNDHFVGLDTTLHNGDVVEIIRDKNKKGPNTDWLEFVRTSTARHKIRVHARQKIFDRLRSLITTD